MSSPPPGHNPGGEMPYQPESGDHITISQSCLCPEMSPEDPNHALCMQTKPHAHHHNVIGLSHAPPNPTNHLSQVHVHVHASPKTREVPKTTPPTCNCHLVPGSDSGEIQDANIVQTRKLDAEDSIEVSPLPPALPPRPPPRPRTDGHGTLTSRRRPRDSGNGAGGGGIRKYVFWCTICGGFAAVLGALFLAVYFMLRSYTSTLGYFETVPTFVPATMLILTGLCVMSLARRRNRYSYLIKVCGVCCLVCALTCVLVTITTTVIHMNRLQTLRECVYTQKTRTCTCYSVLLEAHADTDEGMRFVFDSTPDCEVIHGALYSCLRAMFGLSVSGILVCIFSCMLVYQLLSHERKKMYWEQLELRCRSLYQQQGSTISTQGSGRRPPVAPVPYCSCCEECRYPPTGHAPYAWETHGALDRFWMPGRIGNFYSPNPGEEALARQGSGERRGRDRGGSGWSWRRLPWTRGNTQPEPYRDNSLSYRQNISSPDSQYGFSNRTGEPNTIANSEQITGSTGSYSVLDNRPVGGVYVWGPPPPYSNPNSPARRPAQSPARYHHVHHHHQHTAHCQMNEESQAQTNSDCQLRRGRGSKDNYENTSDGQMNSDNAENSDTNTVCTTRKTKKRMDVLTPTYVEEQPDQEQSEEHSYQEPDVNTVIKTIENTADPQQCRFLPRLQGVENAAFQNQESPPQKTEATESEVYFADVSSCCNISVRNDGQDSSLYDEALDSQKPRLMSLQQCVHKQNYLMNNEENPDKNNDNEDYLSHRIGKRQLSTRSRLPFPLPSSDNIRESESCLQLLSKDISSNSLASSVQTPMTESTDDDITSPTFPNPTSDCCVTPYYQSNVRDCEVGVHHQYLAPDAQYEVVKSGSSFSNLANTISCLHGQQLRMLSPPRGRMGSNISTLIQNLGVNPVGLLYGEANSTDEDNMQGHACQSDGTMDSGWQSGSEKQDCSSGDAPTLVTFSDQLDL